MDKNVQRHGLKYSGFNFIIVHVYTRRKPDIIHNIYIIFQYVYGLSGCKLMDINRFRSLTGKMFIFF